MTLADGVESQRRRAGAVKGLLVVTMALDGAAIVSGWAVLQLLRQVSVGLGVTDQQAGTVAIHSVIGILQSLAFVGTAVCWLPWLHRAYGNLKLMGTGKTDHTPRWAVGCWFVPILSLFVPYQVTKELWVRSERRNEVSSIGELPAAPTLTGWWSVFLISRFVGSALLSSSLGAKEISELYGVTFLGILNDLTGIPAAWLALLVIRRIDTLQWEARSTVGESPHADAMA